MTSRVRLRLLGSAQVEREGRGAESLAPGKALALLGYLAVRDQPLTREHLADLLWPDRPAGRGRANLSWLLHQLNNRLPGCLDAGRHTLQFQRGPACWLDLDAFAGLLARGDAPALAEAVQLYRGDLLAGLHLDGCADFELWLVGERERWRRRAVRALRALVRHHDGQGEHRQALRYARRLLDLEPWLEEAHCQVMRLLALRGRRAAALAQYEACCRVLAGALGVEPGPETTRLYEQIRAGEVMGPVPASPPSLPPERRHNLPSWPTPLVGREAEVTEVSGLLRNPGCRLLTLVGPPGVGKTRLGVQVAAALLASAEPAFADGIFFVALAPVRDPALVAPTIAQVLGVRQLERQPVPDLLRAYLRDRQVLLVLDNFEHLPQAAPLVGKLLGAAPRLKVLATSRASLHVYGEHSYPVPPLPLPNLQALPPPDGAAQAGAVQLFTQRARAARAGFCLTGENAPAVAEICVRLDGLPLAIELAAARVRLLPPQQMLDQLQQRLRFLTGGPRDLPARYRTLRGTIDWSHNLLDDAERMLFWRLGVFVGGWSLEAAEAVCCISGDLDALGRLETLVDHNLVQQSGTRGEPRFVMLETLREYALERLVESGEAETIRERHARFFLTLMEEAEFYLFGAESAAWLRQLEREDDNLRAALAWSIDANVELGLRLAGALGRFWHCRSHHGEGRDWLMKALAESELRDEDLRHLRARAFNQAGYLASFQRDMAAACSLHEKSVALWQEVGDERGLAWALCDYGAAVGRLGELSTALSLLAESVALFRQIGDTTGLSMVLFWCGHVAYLARDYESARASAEESMALARQVGDVDTVAGPTSTLGRIAFDEGDYQAARSLAEESLAIWQQTGDQPGQAIALHCLGNVYYVQGDYQQARQLYKKSLAIWQVIGGRSATADSLNYLGFVSLRQGQWQEAQECFTKSLNMFQEVEYEPGVVLCLMGLAGVAVEQAQPEQAARLLGVIAVLLESWDPGLSVFYQAEYDRITAAVRGQLGGAAFEAARAAGRTMAADEAQRDWERVVAAVLGRDMRR